MWCDVMICALLATRMEEWNGMGLENDDWCKRDGRNEDVYIYVADGEREYIYTASSFGGMR